jgi:fibronectin type 3 domain-containing protein
MKASRVAWILVVIVAAGLALFMYSQARGKAATHSVTLRWSPTPDANFYNVYRGSASGGPYSKLGTAHVQMYVDKPVSSGAVFYYVVTAVRNGRESAYSQEIKAAVP